MTPVRRAERGEEPAVAPAVAYARNVGPALATRTEKPPVTIQRALAVWLVLREAKLLVGGYEVGVNDGPLVRLLHRVTRTMAGEAWCAAFVGFCCAILGGAYPLELHAYCPDLAVDARANGVLATDPEVGDIALYWWHVPGEQTVRFAHTGIVIALRPDGSLETLEGNTNSDGGRDGWQVCRKIRTLAPMDRVIHWHHLLPE